MESNTMATTTRRSLAGAALGLVGAVAIRAAIGRAGLDPASVDGVVMGNVIQAGNRMNPARQAAIGAGIPVAAPALTVNRV
jgi:acetyl-CoA C-acetyltransferase